MKRYEFGYVGFVSLNRIGAFKKKKDKLHKYQVAIIAINGARRHGSEILYSGDFTICYSGNEEQSFFGTGFVIQKNYKHLIINFHPESYRLYSLRVEGKFFNITMMCIRVPAEEKDEECKDAFCGHLERTYLKLQNTIRR
jgi:hypothetical protein